ncbi:MAG: lysophospholipid acyltransferase family protein, partial [Candidatus Omnitrophica bacterium]|nr:lysophospholipid acyltransferase family protein [Candidatus Omnitrophota bacterium]
MKKDSIIDYAGSLLFRILGPLIRLLPKGFSFFLGRRLGELFYYFDLKHKAQAYVNIKTAFAGKLSLRQISKVTKDFYRAYGQNLIEIFLIPLIDNEYVKKYITIEGLEHIRQGFRRGKGVVLVGMHEGSWELSNIICACVGFPFNLFVAEQRFARLSKILNHYRGQKGCKFIERENQLSQLIQVLKNNEAVGMSADQGGRSGLNVKFFDKDASMPQGAVRLAQKYGCALIPVFYTRIKGPRVKIIIKPPLEVKDTGNADSDTR